MLISALWLSSLAFQPLAEAAYESLASRRAWQFSEISDATGSILCRAATAQSSSSIPIELSVVYPKNGETLPRIEIRSKLSVSLLAVVHSENLREGVFPLQVAATPEEENIYWYAPQNFQKLEKFIRDKNALTLMVDPKGANQTIQLSLAGSANALDQVQNCRKGAPSPATFLSMLAKRENLLNPDLGDKSVALLKQSTELAFVAYRKGLSINESLAQIRKPYAAQLKQEDRAKLDFATRQRNVVESESKLVDAQRTAANAEQKLNGARAELAQLQAEKVVADKDLTDKRAIYLPLKAQMDSADKKVSDARRLVDGTEREISQNEAVISRNERQIRNLEVERANLRRALPQQREEAQRLRRIYDDAESDFRRYDVRWETERALQSDSSYRMAKWDHERAQREVQQARWDLDRANSAWQGALQNLDRCRMQPNSPNCSNEEAEVRRWEQARASANNQLIQAQNAENWAESRMRDRERSIQGEIQRNSDRLRAIRDTAESNYRNASNEVDHSESRLAEIDGALPRLRAEMERARDRLPLLRSQLESQRATLNQAIAERQGLAERIGFPEAERNFLEASRRAEALNKSIAAKNAEIPSLARALDRAQKAIPPLEKALITARTELAKSDAALKAIQEKLKPLREQEAPLLSDLASENGRFQLNKELFQDLADLLSQDLR